MGKFEDYMVEEGFFNCASHGFREGWKAFAKKRAEEKQETEKTELTKKIMAAEGDQLKKLLKQVVDKNMTIDSKGKVQDEDRETVKTDSSWLREHVRSQRRREASKDSQGRSLQATGAEERELVGDSPDSHREH